MLNQSELNFYGFNQNNIMAQRSGAEYPAVVLDDIQKSAAAVLRANDYGGYYKKFLEGV